ncbi:hypothetical protein EU537_09110 [Candidatus Thorarchaeota archaeon]|nr:MAG: hypothetical protein EU537_09110 [Candidatus Thorarchaeota archaeon]
MVDLLAYFILYFFAGLTLKIGDDLLDELHRSSLSWIPLAVSGALFGILMANSEWHFVLLTAIVIGVILSGKVNRREFLAGFAAIAAVLLLLGIPPVTDWLDWSALLIALMLAAILDEKGNDWADERVSPRAYRFFSYRMTMKISALLLSIPWPGFFLSAIGLWIFDAGYEIARLLRLRFYQS